MNVGVGDLLEVTDDEGPGEAKPTKKKAAGLPELDGEESVADFVSKYKKTCLNKRQVFRETSERLVKEECAGHEKLP